MLMLLHKPRPVCPTADSGWARICMPMRLVPENHAEFHDTVMSNMQDKDHVFGVRSISQITFYSRLPGLVYLRF